MKFFAIAAVLMFALATIACATPDEPRYASPPPGSHSPFAPPDETDPQRDDEFEPQPEAEEEEEPEEPVERN